MRILSTISPTQLILQLRLLTTLLLLLQLSTTVCKEFDWNTGYTAAYLSATTYCNTETFLTRAYNNNYADGFITTTVINNIVTDTQGFIGYIPNRCQIYVVFRGSQSLADWFYNLDSTLLPFPHCSNCYVHKGFYEAEISVLKTIVETVHELLQQFPDFEVIVTGHSLGAALATLTAIELVNEGVPDTTIRLFSYGSPRVGNYEFANYASDLLTDFYRVTHHKDIVPHTPSHDRFTHISSEWYEDNSNSVRECYGFEDSTCSYQWQLLSISDHMTYLNVHMGCDNSS